MHVEPREEHRWLEQLVGDWTYESDPMGPPDKQEVERGTLSARTLGGVWLVCELRSDRSENAGAASIMTLGYDPEKRRYVGTFISWMMANLWIYDGEMEAGGKAIALHAEGPSFAMEGKTAPYVDRVEITSDDAWVMTSSTPDAEGTWQRFMTMRFRRAGARAT